MLFPSWIDFAFPSPVKFTPVFLTLSFWWLVSWVPLPNAPSTPLETQSHFTFLFSIVTTGYILTSEHSELWTTIENEYKVFVFLGLGYLIKLSNFILNVLPEFTDKIDWLSFFLKNKDNEPWHAHKTPIVSVVIQWWYHLIFRTVVKILKR